ncbi:hypothetical protein SPSYN_01953 [Sporotomaculum syntrophicum]|uniref:Uncharacterized protein n=1 Tax=Sporotomaculum syntrophicum TaxID=182264 RepID=A0A9D2WPM8_9FIRM|nr:hypothetical protein SPSYN_01953 [Sporotomaculum syntrophicum]
MRDVSTKQRLLKIIEILRTETDAEHRLSIRELLDKLKSAFLNLNIY